ncbi:MAG: MFS transporter [Euryarchaeota archaeon]|nr:MFS transporter [Euryarchaeota archaeon]
MADADDTLPQGARRWTLVVTVLASSLVIIDVTAMNVIVPDIQADLGATIGEMQWVIAAYTLFLSSVMLTGGALADRYGRRRLLGLGTVLFATASLAAGLAPGAVSLIVARAFQGLGGALLVPGSLSLLGAAYSGEDRGRAIGVWSGASALMAVIGPVAGGILADLASWRWLFFINVPLGILILVPLILRVPESRDEESAGRLDLTGAALATSGLAGITFGLIHAGSAGWLDPVVLGAFVAGILILGAFITHEKHTAHPMLPLRLFRHRDFSLSNLLTFFVYAALAAGMFFIPMRLILLEGYRPAYAGLAMLPVVLMIGLLSPGMGTLSARYGRIQLIAGPILVAIGYGLLVLPGMHPSYWTGHLPGLLAIGLGMGLVAAPVANVVLSSVPKRHVGLASGVNNAVSRVSALFAIALSGTIALGAFGHFLAPALDDIALEQEERETAWQERVDLADAEPPQALDPHEAGQVTMAYDRAFLFAYRVVQGTMGAFAATGAAIALFLSRGSARRHPETPTPAM